MSPKHGNEMSTQDTQLRGRVSVQKEGGTELTLAETLGNTCKKARSTDGKDMPAHVRDLAFQAHPGTGEAEMEGPLELTG